MSNELAISTAREIRANVNLIQEVMKEVMKKDVHYGIIPGCKKPSLYKPGSEKILSTFRLAVEPLVEDLSTSDCARFRVNARITHIGSGQFVGSGIGECSSSEEKYQWRKAVCEEEYSETPEDRKREKWVKPYNGDAYKIKQVRTNVADVANTILKMAKKRAQIDATLTATAASDVFDQDIEDLPEELRPNGEEVAAPKSGKPAVSMPESTDEPISAVDIVALSQAKVGEKLTVAALVLSSKKSEDKKPHQYAIVDILNEATVQLFVKAFGDFVDVKQGTIAVFKDVEVGEYNGKKQYVAKAVSSAS